MFKLKVVLSELPASRLSELPASLLEGSCRNEEGALSSRSLANAVQGGMKMGEAG
ncbi:hypothetical protein HYT01_03355 [Candidatus Giovannonibacteria bacterium]|nr:hypothetical protein [Candidatus Giovannonibacteria bacterium]